MSTMMTRVEKFQDDYMELMKRIEEPVVKYTGEITTRLAKYVTGRPEFMASLPTLPEMVENGLTFRKRMVDHQATFARKMVRAMEPVLVKTGSSEVKPAPVAKVAPATVTRMPGRSAKRAAKPVAKRPAA